MKTRIAAFGGTVKEFREYLKEQKEKALLAGTK